MFSERHGEAVVVWAPAKVNLYLEVLAKRADGYHEIATLMVAVSLYDTLEFKEDATGEIHLHCNQAELSAGPADNLVYRAAALLRERSGRKILLITNAKFPTPCPVTPFLCVSAAKNE